MDEDKEFKLKLLTHRLEVVKFIVTGLILGIATFVSTCTFKKYELRIQSKTAESTNLKPYLDKYMDLVQKDSLRYDHALEMATFVHLTSTDEEINAAWKDFRTYLQQRLSRFKHERDSLSKETRTADSVLAVKHARMKQIQYQSKTDKTIVRKHLLLTVLNSLFQLIR